MPRKPRCTSHVHRISAPQPQRNHSRPQPLIIATSVLFTTHLQGMILTLLLRCQPIQPDNENRIAPNRHANQTLITLLRDITVHAQGVAGRIQVYDGSFGFHVGKHGFQELGDVWREGRWPTWWIEFGSPVVLAAKREPAELLGEELRDRERLVDGGVFGMEYGSC